MHGSSPAPTTLCRPPGLQMGGLVRLPAADGSLYDVESIADGRFNKPART